jgi:catechol 2,3-dioxygenase-like lactoylglutathione lyase family enzyme
MVAIDAFAGRSIFQLAFVVRSLEDALERYSAALDAAPWRCWTLGADGHEETEYRGGSTSFSSRLALNGRSPQLELIEPLTGPSAHQDWLQQHGEGPHHVGIIVDSVRSAIAQMAAVGYPLVQRGAGLGPQRDGAWAYFDTTETLGLMIEAVEPPTSMPPIDFIWPSHAGDN